MANRGFRNPRRVTLICLASAVTGWAAVAWGIFEMQRLGQETVATGTSIGLGLPVGVVATGMLALAINGARIVAAIRHGEKVIARWTVSPDDFAAFTTNNAARNALGSDYRNDWKPPRTITPEGIEIVFRPDGVLVGDTYFGLVNTGMFKFEGVQMLPENPLAIEFGTVTTTISNVSTVRIDRNRGVLRLPVSRLARAEAVRVLDYYKKVDAREIVVNAGFYLSRKRFGLIAAPICFLAAAVGFAIEFSGYGGILGELLPLLLAVGGVIFGLGALILVLLAWSLSRAQHRKRR